MTDEKAAWLEYERAEKESREAWDRAYEWERKKNEAFKKWRQEQDWNWAKKMTRERLGYIKSKLHVKEPNPNRSA